MPRENDTSRTGRGSRGTSARRGSGEGRPPRTSRSGHTAHSGRSRSSRPVGAAAPVAVSDGSSRAFWPIVIFAAVALLFLGRLVYLQVFMAGTYSAMAQEARTADIETSPRRGTIYDRNGTVLATSVDATTIYANPHEVENPKDAAGQLAEVLGGEAADYEVILRTEDVSFVYVTRKADVEAAAAVKKRAIPGIYFIADTRREYPCGQIGGQIIGSVDPDGNGTSGLELYYDDILCGEAGRLVVERGVNGIPIPGGVQEETPARDGEDIMVSIDVELQEYLEARLAVGVSDLGASGGNSVVMDAGTGEIYACASLPYFNPADRSKVEPGATQLKSVTDAFEPGSIFKTVSAMALLETNTMAPDDVIFCPASIDADEYTVSDAHDRDDMDMSLRDIIDQSSNVGISLSTEKMGFQQLYDHIIAYNLNEPTGVDYPGEAGGYLAPFSSWSKIQAYNVSFGQGVSVTPLQMTRFYGALVNEGVECTPHFLIAKPQTGEVPTYGTEDVIANKEAIPTMVDMLRTVVTDGTGKLAAIDGFNVAGKTSTAEIFDPEGGYRKGVYNLCFTGFLAGSSSQLVCFVGANEVGTDGATVAPVFKDIMATAIDRFKISPN